MATVVERLIATATSEIGYIEKATNSQLGSPLANPGNGDYTKYAAFLDSLDVVYSGKKNGYAWCDVFVDYCFIKTFGLELGMKLLCQPKNGSGAICTNSMNYYKKNNQFHTSNPQKGDQIFFSTNDGTTSYHTGLVIGSDTTYVYTIEGNTSSLPGVVANGGCVRDKKYTLKYPYICGYGRPDWGMAEEIEGGQGMTQDEFNKMFDVAMANYTANANAAQAQPWSQVARDWAIANGIILGVGANQDGSTNYLWGGAVTREQLATVMYRSLNSLGLVE